MYYTFFEICEFIEYVDYAGYYYPTKLVETGGAITEIFDKDLYSAQYEQLIGTYSSDKGDTFELT
ncbi:MAG: hypothetical protein R3Y35_04295 [Clostridia bacterium]